MVLFFCVKCCVIMNKISFEGVNNMRVLHIMSGFGGGISSFIYNKAVALVKEKIIFDVVTYDQCSERFIEAIQATGGNVYTLINPKKEGWKSFIHSFESIFQHYDYDVVHCHINGYRVLPYYIIAKKYVNRFYIHAHDSRALYSRAIINKLQRLFNQRINCQLSDAYLGCGNLAIQSVFGAVEKTKQMVVPNSIAIERFLIDEEQLMQKKSELRARYQILDNQIIVGQIGRLKAVKNIEFTLDLAKKSEDQQQKLQFFIVGSGELEAKLKDSAKEKRIDKRVTFLGRIDPIESIMPMFDVLLLPSFYEGLPTVAVEAQAMGIPILMNQSITKEVDFGIDLVSYLSTDEPYEKWINEICQLSQIKRPDFKERLQVIQSYKFTNDLSAKLYLDFLEGKLSTYQLN